MKINILWSWWWEGIPSPFCRCHICQSTNDQINKNFRTRPEFLFESDEWKFLLEISPDIKQLSMKHNLEWIEDFVVSHWHFDHMYWLLELGAWIQLKLQKKINIYCSKWTREWLEKNFAHVPIKIIELTPYVPFKLKWFDITPLPVCHIWWQDKDVNEDELNNTLAFLIEHNGKKAAYLADYFKIPEKSMEKIRNIDLVIPDWTYLFEEEFENDFYHNELKKDSDHLHWQEIFDLIKEINAQKTIFHSITHLSGNNNEELIKKMPENVLIPYDGMEIQL